MTLTQTSDTPTQPRSKSQDVLFRVRLRDNRKGTLRLEGNRLTFTEFSGQILLDIQTTDIKNVKQWSTTLKIVTAGKKYYLLFVPLTTKGQLRDPYTRTQ
jgi:hypothetical protein